MGLVRYYQLCLGLPLLVPLLLLVILSLTSTFGGFTSYPSIFGVIVMAPSIGGVPYLLTIVPLLWYGWNREASWWRNLSFVLPLIYALVLGLGYFLLFAILTKGSSLSSGEHVELFLAQFGLLIGYAYMALCHLGLLILRPLGLIKET